MEIKVIKFGIFCALLISLIFILGCELPHKFPDLNYNSFPNSHCFNIERLTDTPALIFKEGSPEVVIAKDGTVSVLWLSVATKTPFIFGRYLAEEGWSAAEMLASCVGSWDVAPGPEGGFLLARSDWGNIYVDEPWDSGSWVLSFTGRAERPAITSTDTGVYTIWQRKIPEGSFVVEGAIYRESNWSTPVRSLTPEYRATRLFILGNKPGNLLLIIEMGNGIYVAKLSDELQLETPLIRIHSSPTEILYATGTTAQDGAYWLTWAEGSSGEGQIYVASSSDGETWSEPQRISIEGERNLYPAITADRGYLYIVWTSFVQGGSGVYGQIKGRKHPVGEAEAGWQKIEELYQTPILGEDASIVARYGEVWLAWEQNWDIYALRLYN